MNYPDLVDPDEYPDLVDPDDTSKNPVVPAGVSWEDAGGKMTGGGGEGGTPGFLKSLDLINTGVHRGVTNFTLGIMSKLSDNKNYQARIKQFDSEVQAEQDYNKNTYSSILPQLGEVAGELTATAPAGGVFGGVVKGAKYLGSVAPYGAKTLAKYGSGALGAVAATAGIESNRFNPENPGEPMNMDAVEGVLENPALAGAAGMLGVKARTWLDASRKLGKARKLDPLAVATNVKDHQSPSKKFQDQVFGVLPAFTDMGNQVKQLENIGDAVGNWVQKASASPNTYKTVEEIRNYAGKQVQGALNITRLKNQQAWEKPFKYKPIVDQDAVRSQVTKALEGINEMVSAVPKAALKKKLLEKELSNKVLTVENVKNIQSTLYGVSDDIYEIGGGSAKSIADEFKTIQDDLDPLLQNSLTDAEKADWMAAKQHTVMYKELMNSSKLVEKAVEDTVSANELVFNMAGTPRQWNKAQKLYASMPEKSQEAVITSKIADAFGAAQKPGGFDLTTFLDATRSGAFPDAMRKSDTYKSLEGLHAYLLNVNKSTKTSGWKQLAVGSAIAGATGLGAATIGATGAALPVIGFLAANYISKHSHLKDLFNAATKNLPEETYKAVSNAIEKRLTHAGYGVSQNGVFEKQEKK